MPMVRIKQFSPLPPSPSKQKHIKKGEELFESNHSKRGSAQSAAEPWSSLVDSSTSQLSGRLLATNAVSRDLIIHETIKGLLNTINSLQLRCEALETMNDEMKSAIESLKITDDDPSTVESTPAHNPMVAYESDESENTPAQDAVTDITEVQESINIVSKILAEHSDRLDAHDLHTKLVEKQTERKAHDQTQLKGRVGALEKDVRDLKDDVDKLTTDNGEEFQSTESAISAESFIFLSDDFQRLKVRLTNLEAKCDTLAAVVESEGKAPDYNNSTSSTNSNAVDNDEHPTLNIAQNRALKLALAPLKAMQHFFENQRIVDEAPTKNALYLMFHQLGAIVARGHGTTATESEGPFKTNADDAFHLRDHVLARIAVFDAQSRALVEANAARDELGL